MYGCYYAISYKEFLLTLKIVIDIIIHIVVIKFITRYEFRSALVKRETSIRTSVEIFIKYIKYYEKNDIFIILILFRKLTC